MLAAILICSGLSAEAQIERTADFHSRSTLKEAVVLSRHNIRSPLSWPESALGQLTPHEWFHWSSGKSELSLRGGVLETEMGQFFRKWLVSEGLISENHLPAEGTMRFYANSMQRTIATTQYFSSGLLPVANVEIEHHYDLNTMDPVFTPQLTAASDDYCARARQQIADLFGNGSLEGIGEKMAENYALLQDVLDVEQSAAWQTGGFSGFKVDDTNILLELNKEPGMTGSLKTACSASDALVLQYYEEPDELKAAFGDDVEVAEESEKVVNDGFSTICFNKMETPAIAPNKPVLLKTSTAGTVYEFENRTVAAGANDVIGTNFDFVGTYKPGKVAAGDYLIGSNKLFLSDGTTNIAGTHAYLKAKAAEVKAELFIDDVATAIESIDAENAQTAGAIFNMAGQRVQKTQKGIYVIGSKKVVVK